MSFEFNVKRLLIGILVLVCAAPALAQQMPPAFNDPANVAGNTAWHNLRNIPARAPGRAVEAGLIRYQNTIRPPLANFDISETSRPLNLRQEFTIAAIEVISEQLNALIEAFEILLLTRAGLDPDLGGDMMDDEGNGDEMDETDDDVMDDEDTTDNGDTTGDGDTFVPDRGDLGRPDNRRSTPTTFRTLSDFAGRRTK